MQKFLHFLLCAMALSFAACKDKNDPDMNGNQLTPMANATLEDYLGTYTMTMYNPWDERGAGMYRMDSIVIGYEPTEEYIWIENFPYKFHAFGIWDAASHSILLGNEYYGPDDVFVHEGVNIAPMFTPVYYDRVQDVFYRTEDGSGHSYIRLVMMSDGSLAMVAPDTPGTKGYYSNAFTYYLYIEETWQEDAYLNVFTDVTLTKMSATGAPARGALAPAHAIPARSTATPARHTQSRPMTRETSRFDINIQNTTQY